jgi:hypothetical protein
MTSVESRLFNEDNITKCLQWIRDNIHGSFAIHLYIGHSVVYSYISAYTRENINDLIRIGLEPQYYTVILESSDLKTLSLYKLIWG